MSSFLACTAQDTNREEHNTTRRFVDLYNQKQYDSIFEMFSPDMKKFLPLPATTGFFTELMFDYGEIKEYNLKDTASSMRSYNAKFSKGVFVMELAEDKSGKITGLRFTPTFDNNARNKTAMDLPFEGEWYVFWGGDTEKQNYHVIDRAQKNAFDFVIVDSKGKTYRTNGKSNEDYYAFGQKLLSPCDAVVVSIEDGIPDNTPGQMNPQKVAGNNIVLKSELNDYILFAHFKVNSMVVKAGDKVKKGQFLGLCGNSGNSSEPHLHFHLQDHPDMKNATGIKCFFDKVIVKGEKKNEYSPVQGDKIKMVD